MLDARRAHCLHFMGITHWAKREDLRVEVAAPGEVVLPVAAPTHETTLQQRPKSALQNVADILASNESVSAAKVSSSSPPLVVPVVGTAGWAELKSVVSACHVCELSKGRTQTVFGVGDERADWMVIGEAPGEQEDLRGEPFVGRAGMLLTNMLKAVGLEREAVYIANVVKCRPPKNRDPLAEEVEACSAYLTRQIELIQPKLLLVVGRVAAQRLLGTDDPVGKLRGRIHHFPGTLVPMIVTYHPAYLLRRPSEKRKAWEDLKLALDVSQRARKHG